MDDSIGFSTAQNIGNYPESSFTFQNKYNFFFGTSHKFFSKKNGTLWIKKNKAKWIGYLGIILDTNFIPLQNEPSPILVRPKLGEP